MKVFIRKRLFFLLDFAEWAIFIVKKKLYMLLRGSLSQDWVKFLPKVVESYNHTPSKKLGGIAPETIHSEIDSVRVAQAQQQNNITIYREPNFHNQIQNQEIYNKNSQNLKEGDYVYLSTNEDLFAKSYDVKVILISEQVKKRLSFVFRKDTLHCTKITFFKRRCFYCTICLIEKMVPTYY
jgi:hypothetical protein